MLFKKKFSCQICIINHICILYIVIYFFQIITNVVCSLYRVRIKYRTNPLTSSKNKIMSSVLKLILHGLFINSVLIFHSIYKQWKFLFMLLQNGCTPNLYPLDPSHLYQ